MNSVTATPEMLDFVKSIASESRLNILLLFLDGQEQTVNQISEAIGLGQPTTSEHLAVMRRAGVLTSEKRGKEVYYRPDRLRIAQYLETLSAVLKSCCQ
jgi:ArsR family transcriptional regulator, arsenate/arsenite/antimonite-responsive transcriptional repressor